jgi:DNA polymerase-3 subunit beta
MRIMATEATPVRMRQSADALELRAVSQEAGTAQEELDAKYEGSELEVAFNPTYLIDGLEVAVGDELILESIDSLKPALLRSSEAAEFKYLLMPVRVA